MMSAIDHVDHVASLHIAISPFTLTLSKVKKKKKMSKIYLRKEFALIIYSYKFDMIANY